jgi:Ca2+-binding EF-hand superfamily protein
MKRIYVLTLALCVIGFITSTPAFAAKSDGPRSKFFAKYDKNKNGVIDDDEKDAIRKDFAAEPEGDLKRFDKNHDGKLDDSEIAAIKPPAGKKTEKGEKTKKGKKSKEADAGTTDKTEKTEKSDKADK